MSEEKIHRPTFDLQPREEKSGEMKIYGETMELKSKRESVLAQEERERERKRERERERLAKSYKTQNRISNTIPVFLFFSPFYVFLFLFLHLLHSLTPAHFNFLIDLFLFPQK